MKIVDLPKQRFLFISILMIVTACNQPKEELFFSADKFSIDESERLIIVLESELKEQHTIQSICLGHASFDFLEQTNHLQSGIPYMVKDNRGDVFVLYLSEVPIIHINIPEKLDHKKEVDAQFSLKGKGMETIHSHAKIKPHGGHTLHFPKRSIRVKLFSDENMTDKNKLALSNMRMDDDWILQAMYNEPVRLRDKSSHELWLQMNHPTEQQKKRKGKNGVATNYVELFLNNEYQGVYTLSEKIDRKQLSLKRSKNNLTKGELIKGKGWVNTLFEELTPLPPNDSLEWGSFYYKYPKENVNWSDLHDFIQFVMHSNDSSFYQNISTYFDVDNAINYFIFLNVLSASDNTGKNIYLAKQDRKAPYYYVPWDLDAVFGSDFSGARSVARDKDIVSNLLFDRMFLSQNSPFRANLLNRWKELTSLGVITNENIISIINENYVKLHSNGVYLREIRKWNDYNFNKEDILFLRTWVDKRINFLDKFFTQELSGEPT